MKTQNCDYGYNCLGYATAASLVIGIITAVLRYTAVITLTPAFLWVVFGVAVLFLVLAVLTPTRNRDKECVCESQSARLTGILGTILTSVILLGIEFVATSFAGAVISGLLLFFFSLLITSSVCLVKCKSDCDDEDE